MYKHRIKESVENIKPNGSPDIQNIVTCSEIMLDGVLPAIHQMLHTDPYYHTDFGDTVCFFCGNDRGEEHEEDCAYDKLKKIAQFMHKE